MHDNIDSPIIVITGIRRIGKTSVLNVFLNEVSIPSISVDLRELKNNYGFRDLYNALAKSFSSRLDKFIDLVKSISAVRVVGTEVEFRWKGRGSISLSTLFDYMNKKRGIIAFDEAQRLRGPRSQEILNAIAHAYDYDRNLTFIFTGSEDGLLYSFLGLQNPESPLYGRYMYMLTLERFPRDLSVEFLEQGFEEAGVNAPSSIVESAIETFDGIPGWLTFFGNEYVRGVRDIERVKEMAIEIALGELKNIVAERGKRYALALRGLAEGTNSWGKLKRYIEEKEGGVVSTSIMYNIVKTLEGLSIVKDYEFLDPVYRKAAKMLT